jgi:PAS domain S-box-containing protein
MKRLKPEGLELTRVAVLVHSGRRAPTPPPVGPRVGSPGPHAAAQGDQAGLNVAQRKVAAALRQSDDAQLGGTGLLGVLLDSTSDHIDVKDPDGRYVLVNRASAAWFGRPVEDIVGLTEADLHGPEAAAPAISRDRAVIASGTPIDFEQEGTYNGVTRTWLTTKNVVRDPGGRTIGLFTISHEITDQRRQEAQLRQSAKMEAIGQLAGGIAHDFNNMLTAIRGYTELVRAHLPPGNDEDVADLEQVIISADRAAELTRQLLAFSRRQVLAPRVLDPAETVGAIAPMLRRLLGEQVELTIRSAPGLGKIRVDPAQLDQVILNLAVNARDAMPDGGQLRIETANADLDAGYVSGHPGAQAGPHVRLIVTDSGTGMDAVTRERLFEPFFTTKEAGRGTGLGLATVYGIVKQSGGSIDVYSEVGLGTTFRVYFPRIASEPAAVSKAVAPAEVPTGVETILLVEDESAVRGFARRALTGLGYVVLEAANGREALSIANNHAGHIDLLVTDVIMPGIHGSELSLQLTAGRPGLRTLFASGFPEDSFVRNAILLDEVHYLPKPFSAAALGCAVRTALDT